MKIENLGIETTLEKFVEDWGLNINEINVKLDESSYYSDDFVEIQRKNNIITSRILTDFWEVMDTVNDIYDDYYLFIVKDVYTGYNNEDFEELNYTQFLIENPTSKTKDIVFNGGEYDEKSILNENQLSKFYNQREDENIDWTDSLKYREVWFVREEDLIKNGWGKTIKSFNLDDWDKYPY